MGVPLPFPCGKSHFAFRLLFCFPFIIGNKRKVQMNLRKPAFRFSVYSRGYQESGSEPFKYTNPETSMNSFFAEL